MAILFFSQQNRVSIFFSNSSLLFQLDNLTNTKFHTADKALDIQTEQRFSSEERIPFPSTRLCKLSVRIAVSLSV